MATTLIVTEKPDAALHVAEALARDQSPKKINVGGVPFFEVHEAGGRILVCSALGHLYAVSAKGTEVRSQYPVWDLTWKPKHLAERGQGRQEKWIDAISKVSKEADRFINACVAPGTLISTSRGQIPISDLEPTEPGASINDVITVSGASDSPTERRIVRYVALDPQLMGRECFELISRTGRRVKATEDHRFMTPAQWKPLGRLRPGDNVAVLPIPSLPPMETSSAVVLTEEQLWVQLKSLASRQSRARHSKYRYQSSDYATVQHLRQKGLTYPEIATRTGLTLRTVRGWLGERKAPYTVTNPAIQQLREQALIPLNLDSRKICAIARLAGAVFAHGCLWQSAVRWSACGLVVTCGYSGGADEVVRDLVSLGFKARKRIIVTRGQINGRTFLQKSEEVRCSSLALWLLLRALGAPSGKKTEQSYDIPQWIMKGSKRLQYEFLSTYLGGELGIPTNPRVHPRLFNQPEIRFNKRVNLSENGKKLAIQLASLLSGFGVRVTRIDVRPSGVRRKDCVMTVSIRIGISNDADSLINLLERIPVQYCLRKRIACDLIAEYSRLKYSVGSRRIEPYRKWARCAKRGLERSFLIWDRVLAISRVHCPDMRDLTVDEAHSYVANEFLTHNCDYDIEGSLIGYTILKYACDGADKKALRMKFSTLTVKELRDSYANVLPELDFSLAFAGMCRHEVDWLYGVNLSRALTQSALKAGNRYSTLSTGRVQGPTLRFVVDREREIETFVPLPYWVLRAGFDVDGKVIEAEYELERLDTKSHAEEVVKDCAAKKGVIEKLESKTYQVSPPTPFDLSALQSEAYRHFGFTPRIALSVAERLYLDQLISYPRTSSQKLPPSINYEEILRALGKMGAYRSESSSLLASGILRPNDGKKDDPAHPAVYPTGAVPRGELDARGQKLFDLVVRRFLSTFGKTAAKQSEKATVKVGKHLFFLRGSRILEKGWIDLYGPYAKFQEITLPPLKEGQHVTMAALSLEEKYTQPPLRYNPSSLLKAMEEAEIGTKATRADIIETLYKRGYVKGERITATPLAFRVTEILRKYCPKMVDVTFTRELETMMEQIELGKQTRETVVLETVAYLKPVIEDLKTKELEVGKELTVIIGDMWRASITLFVPCPQCGSTLRIVRNPKTKKRFIGCAGKWAKNCTFGLPLPQFGALKLLEKRCPECGFQLIQVRSKGRRPLVSCPKCFVDKLKAKKPAETVAVNPP